MTFHIPGDGGRRTPDYMQPWTFTSDDGRFEMDYTPVLDRASCSDVGLIKSDQHQVFGVFNGRAVLDDGTVLDVKRPPRLCREGHQQMVKHSKKPLCISQSGFSVLAGITCPRWRRQGC